MEFFERLDRLGVLPAVALEDAGLAVPMAKAMLAGGVDLVEITFRTEAAAECIRRIREACPEMLVGAGTVVNLSQAAEAARLGAGFMVSPGISTAVVEFCKARNIPVIPGVATSTEIMLAMDCGLDTVKFFPAEASGGTAMLKSLHGPFPAMRFLPTGGVKAANMREYLALPYVAAVGGTWLTPAAALKAGDTEKITALCREALGIRKEVRPQ